jgi:hypothetical protein
MTPQFQERHHDYVLGPNQDVRLASVAAGAVIKGITLQLDADAPFELRSRAMRQTYTAALTQAGLQFLKTRWAGPTLDYRQQDFVPQGLEMAYYGQGANPKSVFPPVVFPANGVIVIDVWNTGAAAIPNLTFYWRGVKLFPWGAVPAYSYPDRFGALNFTYPQTISQLGVSEDRQNNIFTVKPDADFVLRAGQVTAPFQIVGDTTETFAEVFIKLKDENKKPYSSDFVHIDILFGSGSPAATIPIGPVPSFVAPFGTGPVAPGLFYPEIYVPKNQQLLYDLLRSDGAVGANQPEDFVITWLGAKVFQK